MTQDEAYIAGFCKAAEAAGVDPEVLYKRAQLKARIGALLGRGLTAIRGAGTAAAASRAGQAAVGGAKRYADLLRGGNTTTRGAFRLGRGDLSSMGNFKGWLQTYAAGLKGNLSTDAASELRKALAARAGTAVAGTAALAGGAHALAGGSDNGGKQLA